MRPISTYIQDTSSSDLLSHEHAFVHEQDRDDDFQIPSGSVCGDSQPAPRQAHCPPSSIASSKASIAITSSSSLPWLTHARTDRRLRSRSMPRLNPTLRAWSLSLYRHVGFARADAQDKKKKVRILQRQPGMDPCKAGGAPCSQLGEGGCFVHTYCRHCTALYCAVSASKPIE